MDPSTTQWPADSYSTVKKHVQEMFDKLGVETRGAATVRALEVLNSDVPNATIPFFGAGHEGKPTLLSVAPMNNIVRP